MKKFLAVLMVLAALLAVQASAEDLPYIQQMEQTRYINLNPLTTESYPEVCLTPYYLHSLYEYHTDEPLFLRFPCPEGTLVSEFSHDSAYFIDFTKEREYAYAMSEQASFELFVNKSTDESLLLADGSEGYAIYLDPSDNEANILIGVDEIKRGVKLQIRLEDGMIDKMTDKQKISRLTDWAQSEVQRVMGSMKVTRMDTYWSAGRYQGISMLVPNIPGDVLTYTVPKLTEFAGVSYPAGAVAFIYDVDYSRFKMYAAFDAEHTAEIDLEISDYTYVESKREDDPASVVDVTMPDGSTCGLYMNWYDSSRNGRTSSLVYLSKAIGTYTTAYNGKVKTVYLTIKVDLSGSDWRTAEACAADLTKIASGVQITSGNEVPMYFDVAPYSAVSAANVNDQPAPSADNAAAPEAPAAQAPATDAPSVDLTSLLDSLMSTPTAEPAAVPGTGAESSFTFRNGLHWGMTPEEVLATEQKLAFQNEQRVNDRVIGRVLPVKLSKFDVNGIYFFVDNQLAAVEFYNPSAQTGDATYLGNALQGVYGDAAINAPVVSKLATAITAVRGNLNGYNNAAFSWSLTNGTVIQLFDFGSNFDLFYANSAVDIDAALTPATPTPIPYDTYGL